MKKKNFRKFSLEKSRGLTGFECWKLPREVFFVFSPQFSTEEQLNHSWCSTKEGREGMFNGNQHISWNKCRLWPNPLVKICSLH